MTEPRFPDRYSQVEALTSTPLERTFRAFDTLLQREVLLRLPAEAAWAGWTVDVRTRLLREAQSLAKVQHDGTESVLWVEETKDGLLVVQALPSGERLFDHLKAGPMAVDAVVALGIGLGEALAAVHYAGLVHRGIGPDAVRLRADGRPVLGGFHFAKAVDQSAGGSSLNHGLRQKATGDADASWLPAYSAPEQLQGRKADARADVYALGCLLFRCLAGHDPLPSGDGAQMPDVRSVRPEVPKALAEILRRCMLAEKTARYPTAQSVVEALKALRETSKPASSRRSVLAAAVAAVAVVGIGAAMWPGGESPKPGYGGGARDLDDPVAAGGSGGVVYSGRYAKGHALLVGIGQGYDGVNVDRLEGPALEVAAVKRRLMQNHPEFWTEESFRILVDGAATKEAVHTQLQELKKAARPDDAVLIYFAGHGQKKPGTTRYFLVCANARSKEVPLDEVGFLDRQELDFRGDGAMAAKHVLVVADCCYSGRLFPETVVGSGDRGRNADAEAAGPVLELPFLKRPVVEFLGSSSNETAKDSKKGELSKFCAAFLEGITPTESGSRYITARQLAGFVESKLVDPAKSIDQFPCYQRVSGGGQFVFWLKPK